MAVPHLMGRLNNERRSRNREEEDEQPVRRNIVEALGRLMNNSDDHKENNTNFVNIYSRMCCQNLTLTSKTPWFALQRKC